KSNRSGVVGVCRYCASETRNLPEDQQRWFWVASWPLPDGKRKRVKFAVNKYGEEKAFKMALKARRDAIRKLEGNFDPGAARRVPKRRSKASSGVDKSVATDGGSGSGSTATIKPSRKALAAV
ncbi:MAG: AP2 domain-containing protein, partial [Rhodocyclaceae bacterium]